MQADLINADQLEVFIKVAEVAEGLRVAGIDLGEFRMFFDTLARHGETGDGIYLLTKMVEIAERLRAAGIDLGEFSELLAAVCPRKSGY